MKTKFVGAVVSVLSIAVPASANPWLGTLQIDWAGIVDNGEGSGGIHGPFGSIHIKVESFIGNRKVGEHKEYLHGVHWTGGKFEWDDGDARSYYDQRFRRGLHLHAWRHVNESVRITIYESDPGPFRSHDTLMVLWVSRSQTMQGGYWWSGRGAHEDAVRRAAQRGGASWVRHVYSRGLHAGMPSMFLQLATR